MRILVPGCAGFIGYHLCDRLLNDGHTVVGVDDLSTGQRENATDLLPREGFSFIEHDIVKPLVGVVPGPLDRVYNMACPASPLDFDGRRLNIMDVCSRGVWNLLDLCRETGARMLHSSTSEVYGDPLEHPQRESYWGHVNPIGARSCYDEGKRFAEALLVNYRARHGVNVRIARIFNTYGPRMRADDGRVLPNFISQAYAGKPLTVHGGGVQTRSFCYVSDLVEGLIRLCESEVETPVNLGNPDETTILEFAREVIAIIGSRSEIQNVPAMQDDPKQRRPDIERARTLLGWTPQVARAEGLRRTISWFAERLAPSV